MTDEQPATADEQTVKSAMDLRIEKLEKQLSDLQAKYDTDIAEALQANRELWAELHPVQDPPTAPEEAKPDAEAEAAFNKALGISEKE